MSLIGLLGWGRSSASASAAPPRYTAPAERWLVLQLGDNPSTYYYVRPRGREAGVPVEYRHIDADAPTAEDLRPGTLVVIVRYLSARWAEALTRHRDGLAGVVYFMDDELLDPSAWKGLPAPYRKKLDHYCRRMAPALAALVSAYWGSTPVLCGRHADRQMLHTPPLPLVEDAGRVPVPVRAGEPVQIFYHGTAAHIDEMRWLRLVITEVLAACPQAHFEVIGDHEVNQIFRHLPRTRVLHPMSWANYLSHCRTMRGHIGLAPLLPGRFNAGRSPTKVFDIARCSSVGLYADVAPYAGFVGQEDVPGRLLNMRPADWVEALVEQVRAAA